MSPALAGGLPSTVPQGKSQLLTFLTNSSQGEAQRQGAVKQTLLMEGGSLSHMALGGRSLIHYSERGVNPPTK